MKKTEQEEEQKNYKKRYSEAEDHEKLRLPTLKRLKRGDVITNIDHHYGLLISFFIIRT